MIAKTGRKAIAGMLDGMDGLRETRLAVKMGIGRPSPGRKALGLLGPRPGMAALAAAATGLLAAGIWYYLRKRRQVTAHYNMGEGGFEPATRRPFEPAEAYRP